MPLAALRETQKDGKPMRMGEGLESESEFLNIHISIVIDISFFVKLPPPTACKSNLKKGALSCNYLSVVAPFKNFLAALMAVLALGVWTPQPACVAIAQASSACCCSCCQTSPGQPTMPCAPSCKVAPTQVSDMHLPARTAAGASLLVGPLLHLLAPVKIIYPAFVVVRHRDVNVSPPFGGSPPQAVLRLWLI